MYIPIYIQYTYNIKQNTLQLILAIILGLVKYSEIVDTIGLEIMTHTFYFIFKHNTH